MRARGRMRREPQLAADPTPMRNEVYHKWDKAPSADVCFRCNLKRRKAGACYEWFVNGVWVKSRKAPRCDDRAKSDRVDSGSGGAVF